MTTMHTPRRRSLGSALPTVATLLLCAGPLFGQPPPAQPPAAQPPAAQPPATPQAGAEGASCRALVDCRQPLKCFQGACRDPNYGNSCQTDQHCGVRLPCVRGVCLDAASAYGPPPPGPPPSGAGPPGPQPPGAGPPPGGWTGPPPPPLEPIKRDWMDFEIGHGVHPFIGISGMPGFSFGLDHASGTTSEVLASMMFAVKAGIFFDDTALELEVSPVTYVPFLDGGKGHLQMNLSLGTYNELTDHVYWPGRFGLGFVTVNTPTTLFEMRADLLGLAFGIGHVMLDLHFPSIRWVTDFDQGATFSFLFGAGVGYVF